MKSACFTVVLLFGFFTNSILAQIQIPKWSWVKRSNVQMTKLDSLSNTGDCSGKSICSDVNGNVYVTGYFGDTAIVFGTDTLLNAGIFNVFIVKYDSSGNVIWAHSPIDSGKDDQVSGTGIITDANGNVYVIGSYESSTIAFQGNTLNRQNGTFLVKYDPNGNVVWLDDLGSHAGYSLRSDPDGNIYITGENAGQIFVAKYDSFGNEIWTKIWGVFGVRDGGEGISLDGYGNIYVSGGYSGTLELGTDTLGYGGVNGAAFIMKIDPSGNLIWAKSSKGRNGTSQDGAVSISTDVSGNSYITGSFTDTIIFGTDTLTNGGYSNMFIVKYDSSGNVLWAKSPGDTGWCWAYGICTDPNGNPYVTGRFINNVAFGSDTLNGTYDYTFIAKYDQFGQAVWAMNASGFDNFGQGICIDATGNLHITGWFVGPIIFGNDTFYSGGESDVFTAKITNYDTSVVILTHPETVSLYPNPSQGEINLQSKKSGYTVEVYNVFGEMVYTTQTNSGNYSLSLSGCTRGVYFYRVSDHGTTIQQGKIVLE